MEAHHASLGRRTLEEIRQKRATERLQRVSSGSDLESSNQNANQRTESGYRASEKDLLALQARVKELEGINVEFARENQKLLSKLEEKEVEKDSFVKRLNDLERNSLPSLRKALNDTSFEKDAAIVAKEDAMSQLRTLRKRLKEAEEEQYRAEEEAAALRAELNLVQQQQGVMSNSTSFSGFSNENTNLIALENELSHLQTQLKQESMMRQQEQQKLAEEQSRISTLLTEKNELEERLTALTKKVAEEASASSPHKAFSVEDKERLEKQMHDLAFMVERLENSRQKLLSEIDSQSSEIERLFEENSSLTTSYQDAMSVTMQWENQVKECLKQNEELRSLLDKFRSEQAGNNHLLPIDSNILRERARGENQSSNMSSPPPDFLSAESLLLKDQLVREQSRAEALTGEVMKLNAELSRALHSHNNLTRLYRPVLRNIENNLMKMKQETYSAI